MSEPTTPTADRPNVLIFMTDHQRGDTVLAEHPCRTPNVDALARDGLTFSETFCPSPHCCPARATFHSGLYPSRHGVWNNVCNGQRLSAGLSEGVRLFSEDLADAGYRLAFSGKWHVSVEEGPSDRGWEELMVSGGRGDFHGQSWEHYEKLAAEPDPTQRGEGQILRPGYGTYVTYGTRDEHPHDEKATSLGVEAIDRFADGDAPWCLFVGATAPHDPYFAPQKYLDMYDLDDVPLPASYEDALADKPRVYRRMRDMRWGQLSEREVREGIRHFWAMCTYLDEQFGRLLQALDRTGQADNTLVLYCSDHGDYCGDHGLFCKGIPCFRGAYHVPAVVRWPNGVAAPGRRVTELVSLADFAPTFTELAGGRPDESLVGRSLVPFLRNERPAGWREAIHTQCDGVELYYTQRSVTTKDFKYVFNGFDLDELYDLRNDPDEMNNLADSPEHQQIKREMVRRMWRFAYEQQDSATNAYITVSLAPWGPAEAFRT